MANGDKVFQKLQGKNTTLCTRWTFLGAPCAGNSSVYQSSSKPKLTVTGPGLVSSSIHLHKPTVKLILANDS